MTDEDKQKKLQELLVAAQGAIDEVKKFAVEHDLCFEISGLRRGYVQENYNGYLEAVDADDVKKYPDDYEGATVEIGSLDFDSGWMGSWSPGCG